MLAYAFVPLPATKRGAGVPRVAGVALPTGYIAYLVSIYQ